jgi:hypothetical protein
MMRRLILLPVFLVVLGCGGGTPMDPSKPLVHEALIPSYPKATEYFLPQPYMPDDVRANLSPWILDLVTSPNPTAERTIRDRLAEIDQPALQPLSEQLQSYRPVSVIIREDKQAWVRLDSEHADENVGSSAFLPTPPDKQRILAQLESTGFSTNEVFSAFAMSFCGLAEDFRSSGNFLEDTEDWSILSEDWQEEIIDNFEEWTGSLLFYHARNGDQLLLHPNGHVGWWKFAEGRVTRECDSFSDFVRFYVKYRADSPWPLDSYGPPDYARRRTK